MKRSEACRIIQVQHNGLESSQHVSQALGRGKRRHLCKEKADERESERERERARDRERERDRERRGKRPESEGLRSILSSASHQLCSSEEVAIPRIAKDELELSVSLGRPSLFSRSICKARVRSSKGSEKTTSKVDRTAPEAAGG